LIGYQSIMIGGIRDPYIIRRLDLWLGDVRSYICKLVERLLGIAENDWKLVFHVYWPQRGDGRH